MTVMGTTTSSATHVTVNLTNTAQLYGDWTFAATNFPFLSSYSAVAKDKFVGEKLKGNEMPISRTDPFYTKYLYDAFGNVLSAAGIMATQNLYRFSRKEAHLNSGLVYYLYRFYDPNLQRWPNRDPIAERGGANLYRFAGNAPSIYADANGLVFSDTRFDVPNMQSPASDSTPVATWTVRACGCGRDTKFIQVVIGGVNLLWFATPLVDNGVYGLGSSPFYPEGGGTSFGPYNATFSDEPDASLQTFEVCRVCVDHKTGSVQSVGPCVTWRPSAQDQNLNQVGTHSPFPSPTWLGQVNKYVPVPYPVAPDNGPNGPQHG